jgi:predicted metal-dependent peptidase
MNKKAEEALSKTKVQLMTKQGTLFLSSVSMQLNHVFDESVPTAATDGKSISYNPEFFLDLTKEERLALLAHEVWHVCFLHMVRKGNRDHKRWNVAADYVINDLLVLNGFKLPKCGLHDVKYRGMSTEDVYDLLEQNNDQSEPDMDDLISSEEISSEDIEKITNIVMKAAMRAQMDGASNSIPNEIVVKIEELLNPKLSWKELLYRFVDSRSKDEFTWKKPNKKYLPECYLPSRYSETINSITVAIDTSGSVTDEEIKEMLTEVQYIYDIFRPSDLTILGCDTHIRDIHHVEDSLDILSLHFSGRGGTSFKEVINYCKEHSTNVLIYFTDLEANQITEDPGYPILWVCTSNHTPAPIGETIYYGNTRKSY